MTNKKIFAPLFIAGACLLASCSTSTIVARPGWGDNPIVDAKDLKDNQMKVIYDAIKALGDTNANVLNEVLYKIAVNQVGSKDELEKYRSENTAVKDDDADLKKFIDGHKLYKPTSTKLAYKDAQGKTVTEDLTPETSIQASRRLIQQQYHELEEGVYEALYNEIKGGTYSKNNLFDEEKFYRNIRKNMYDTLEPNTAKGIIGSWTNDFVIMPKGKDTSWKNYVNYTSENTNGFLHVVDKDNKYYGNDKGTLYKDYIETKVMKDVYRNFLIRDYVKEQRYDNIARSYARKVNMITIPQGSYTGEISNMMHKFALDNVIGKQGYKFSDIETAMKGFVESGSYAETLLTDSKKPFTPINETGETTQLKWKLHDKDGNTYGSQYNVYKGTKLGDLVEKYLKIYDVKVVNNEVVPTLKSNPDSATYKELTNSGAYTINQGLAIKEREIALTSYVKHGWYLKNGGLTDLNSTIRDRLFNISTSNIVDKTGTYTPGDYVARINNKAYLVGDSTSQVVDDKLVVLYDETNYHIIEVEEAISTSKMSKEADNDNSYLKLRMTTDKFASTDAMNEIVNEVVKANSSGDTYKKNANQYYLMISNILFYDQSVYDYFKSQYPDLFK